MRNNWTMVLAIPSYQLEVLRFHHAQGIYEVPWTLSWATVIVRAHAAPSALMNHAIRPAAVGDTP